MTHYGFTNKWRYRILLFTLDFSWQVSFLEFVVTNVLRYGRGISGLWVSSRILSLANFHFYCSSICWGLWVFTHKGSEGEVDKRKDEGSLTEAGRINQVQADRGDRNRDEEWVRLMGLWVGVAANLDFAVAAVYWWTPACSVVIHYYFSPHRDTHIHIQAHVNILSIYTVKENC